jgi:anti-sigma regulatory factor (Ser/Thr protein kinase)
VTAGGPTVRLVPEYRAEATVVTVSGTLTLDSYPDLRDGLLKIATDAPESLIADIRGLRVDDDVLTSVFTVVAQRIGDWPGIPFALVSDRPEHLALLQGRAIDRFVAIHPDVDTAERDRNHPPRRRALQLLAASDAASSLARQFVTRICAEWDVPEHRENALLIATELVENAIRHTDSAPVLRLEARRGVFTVSVGDGDPRPAVLHERVGTLEPGLGLQLIAQVARVWGCSRSWSGGKVVWAVLTERRRRERRDG